MPIEYRDDPIAEVISRNNVGGVVKRCCSLMGFKKSEVWENTNYRYCLTPSKQSIRLVIAE